MGAKNARGVWVPAAGDGLLEGWATAAKQGGMYLPVASVAAARVALDLAQTAGMPATTSNPILFLIGSGAQKVAYTADGSKDTGGKWVLAPINEVEQIEETFTIGGTYTLANEGWKTLLVSGLPARPYDRAVQAFGTAWGYVPSGNVDLALWIGGDDETRATFTPGRSVAQSQTVINFGLIPANTAPDIQLGLRGTTGASGPGGGGTISVTKHERWNRLVVTAQPITMSV